MATHLSTDVTEQIEGAFARAAQMAGEVLEGHFRIANHSVVVRSAGSTAFEWLRGPFQHLRADGDDESGELTVLAWDGRTGGPFPLLPSTNLSASWRQRPFFVEFAPVGATEGRWHRMSGLIDQAHAVYWMSYPDDLAWFERGTPLLTALQRWLSAQGTWLVHAGAVANATGAVLIGGGDGAGKSTTSVACYESGLSFLADDYVAVELGPPRAHSVFCSAKLVWDHPANIGGTLRPVNRREDGDEKALFLLSERVAPVASIAAIVIPKVLPNDRSGLRPMAPSRALRQLAPSTVMQLAGNGAERFQALRSLCETVPAYELVLGTDIAAAVGAVHDLLGP